MSALRARVRGYVADVARGFDRAPVEMALALYIAVMFSTALEIGEEPVAWGETAVAALLILCAAWCGTLLHALGVWSLRTRYAVTIGAAAVVALYAWLLLDFTRAAEVWRAAALVVAAVLCLVAAPAWRAGEDAVARMRRVDGRVLLRTAAVLLYGLALFIGLAVALRAVDTLFELDLEGTLYGHVFGWIFMVLVPWVIFGGLDEYVRPPGGPEAVASAVHRLTLYLVPPLLAIYFLILYAYMVRIGVTGEVPKNLVSPMVLAAAGLTAIALLLFDPQPGSTAFPRALRLTPVLLLPLVPLAAWALILRVGQYGWTEFRAIRVVVLAAFAVLALLATVQLVRRRSLALHVLPLVLAAAALLAVVGPWSVLALSKGSQQERLEAALREVDSVPLQQRTGEGPVRRVPSSLYERVQNDARYLQVHFGAGALPGQLRRFAGRSDEWVDYAEKLGLERIPGAEGPARMYAQRLPPGQPVSARAGTVYRIEFVPQRRLSREEGATVTADSLRLVLHLRDGVVYADIAPLLTQSVRTRGMAAATRSVVPVTDAAGTQRGELVVFEASAQQERGGRVIQYLNGALLIDPPARR